MPLGYSKTNFIHYWTLLVGKYVWLGPVGLGVSWQAVLTHAHGQVQLPIHTTHILTCTHNSIPTCSNCIERKPTTVAGAHLFIESHPVESASTPARSIITLIQDGDYGSQTSCSCVDHDVRVSFHLDHMCQDLWKHNNDGLMASKRLGSGKRGGSTC